MFKIALCFCFAMIAAVAAKPGAYVAYSSPYIASSYTAAYSTPYAAAYTAPYSGAYYASPYTAAYTSYPYASYYVR